MTTHRTHDNGIERDMTADEIKEHQENMARIAQDMSAQIAASEAIAAFKASAEGKLKKLGLTDDEIAALVG